MKIENLDKCDSDTNHGFRNGENSKVMIVNCSSIFWCECKNT